MKLKKLDFFSQVEDHEEELAEVMRKYKACVSQLSVDQITIQEQASNVADLEEERNRLKEQLAELMQKIDSLEGKQGVCQVWSLTQFYCVDFSKSRIGVKKCVFNKCTIKVCISCC